MENMGWHIIEIYGGKHRKYGWHVTEVCIIADNDAFRRNKGGIKAVKNIQDIYQLTLLMTRYLT